MKTHDIPRWCDLVRGLLPPEPERAARAALAAASTAERRAVERLEHVARVAQADLETPVPAYALRAAKAIAGLGRRARPAEKPWPTLGSVLRFLVPTIDFDSLRDALPVGTRDLQPSYRQLVARAGTYTVDLRLEHESEARSTVVVGQVLDSCRPLAEVPVLVLLENRIVARATTNDFGEFQVETLSEPALSLGVLVDDEVCLEIDLDDGSSLNVR